VKDSAPGEASLEAVEEKMLKEQAVVVHRDAPLFIMVFLHECVTRSKAALNTFH
jgi:hypothetical protein